MPGNTLKKALQDKADQIAAGVEIIVQKTNDWQQIMKFYKRRLDESKLTKTQKDKADRYQFIYNQLVSGKYTEAEVVSSLMTIYHVGQTQAYEDMQMARELFVTVISINKLFELKVLLEAAKKMMAKCELMGDIKNWNTAHKNAVGILALIEQEESAPGDMFEGHVIEPVFDPSLIGAPKITKERMQQLMDKISAKRGKKTNFGIEEIPFEDA